LAERAVGLQGIGQGELFNNQAAGTAAESSSEARGYSPVTSALKDYIVALWQQKRDDPIRVELALRAEVSEAYPSLKAAAFRTGLAAEQQASLFSLLREFGKPDIVPSLVEIIAGNQRDAAKIEAIEVLASYDDPVATSALTDVYPSASQDVRHWIRDVAFSRPSTAIAFLQAMNADKFKSDDIPVEQLHRLSVHKNAQIDYLVHARWGNIGPGTSEDKLATMRRFNNDLRAGTGNLIAGKAIFEKTCAVCHQLFGQGNKIGPDLTNANRSDQAALLGNIVDPSTVIRREYMNYVVITTSGRVFTGVMAEQDAAAVTILDANNQRTKIRRSEIDDLREADMSLMPERLLDKLTPQELRDLFGYLQSAPTK
jgi:putative heme-binding domain-containing protein